MQHWAAILFLFLGYPDFALAIDVGLPGSMTKVDATYRCEKEGGGVAFRVPAEPAVAARVWQTDPGEELGLELEVTEFVFARCQGCYAFEAKLAEGLLAIGTTRNAAGKITLSYVLRDLRTNRSRKAGDFPCARVGR
ncbi:MAG: hypothetical protein NDJ89_03900 [Oligoflexia bacterium]|nr:hypothetical protein [Oligoflexia bacterium]